MHYGSALLRIESVKECIYREGGHLHSVGGGTDKNSERDPQCRRYQESFFVATCDNATIFDLVVMHQTYWWIYRFSTPDDACYALFWPS